MAKLVWIWWWLYWMSLSFCESHKWNGCSLQVVVDPSLGDHLEKKWTSKGATEADARREILTLISSHVKFVNTVLDKYSFSPTGESLKLFLKSVQILNYSNCNYRGLNYCDLDPSNVLLAHSSMNHNDYCLSYVFTYRDLGAGFMGKAWTASPMRADFGGACSRHTGQKDLEDEAGFRAPRASHAIRSAETEAQSRNTGLVSFLYKGEMLPEDVSKLVFLHEIGHSLGSQHDEDKNCLNSTHGDFVMNSQGCLYGFFHKDARFSNRSVRNISIAMGSLNTFSRNCFVRVPESVCGNGLVEGREECDCGENEDECKSDPCCYPGDHLEKPCQLKPNAACSPSKGKCCSMECKPVGKLQNKICAEETECSFSSICNESSSLCPAPKQKPNSYPCRGGTMTCLDGECGLSICRKFGLYPCKPLTIEGSCELHCQEQGRPETCYPSTHKNLHFSKPVFHPVNSLCFVKPNESNATILGYCSGRNFCEVEPVRQVTMESLATGLIISFVCYVLIAISGIWIYCNFRKGKCTFRPLRVQSRADPETAPLPTSTGIGVAERSKA